MAASSSMPSSLQVPAEIVRKWQEIVDLGAAIMNVPSAMVMRAEAPNIKVFVSNRSESVRTRLHRHGTLLQDR
jgi:hypothetical protein